MNREVNVTKRVQTAQGLRYCPVVLSANGRIKPDAVLINGREERHPEGAYYLEWREGSKRIRLSVGKNAADAGARRQRKSSGLSAWLAQLTTRTHSNVAAVALANKLARMAWAVLAKNEPYRPPMLVGAATA